MRNCILHFFSSVFVLVACSCDNRSSENDAKISTWTNKRLEAHYKTREDSTNWDMEMFREDLKYIDGNLEFPIKDGVYPVPKYDLVGENSFGGLMVSGSNFSLDNKTLTHKSFAIKRSALNANKFGKRKNEVFFTIVVLTDTLDTTNHNLSSASVISRNHPNYIGQGMIKTKNNNIDFVAFQTINEDSYAIINMRLFDLNFGNLIFIAPQKDKSLRSLQLNVPPIEFEQIGTQLDSILKLSNVQSFIGSSGNI